MTLLASIDEDSTSFQEIPVIDLAMISTEDPDSKKALADKVRAACVNVGFFYGARLPVTNHGISETIIQEAVDRSKDFFSLPLEDKMMASRIVQIENKKSPNFKGYSPLLSGNNDPDNDGDLQEGFEFGLEQIAQGQDDSSDEGVMAGANVWPSQLPEFRRAALQYYHAAVNLGKKLFPLFALALDLPENFFEDKTRHSAALMKMLHYPPQTGPVDGRVLGIGAHTDWECFTILWQEPGIQALQVLNSNQEWIDAPPTPGNDLGMMFSSPTVHRAINRSGVRRYSIPLFFGTDYGVKLEPIPSCVSTERPMKYEVITAGEYVKAKLRATYGH
ncbi:2OG-Fe(II) oxygenase [Armillaria borealis]|uniref:2OG-Fe(II) oxygenase n=1 Tax=Armillaria borealis TaxID=47425 RepID=A0AA39JV13_9AGAR|nr:2OG-Fe(II) oxygenase [Armillaria borealis]